MKFCPICEKIENSEKNEKINNHLELIAIQRQSYMFEKKEIATEIACTIALITQDFTQIELDSGFVQDLIICKYTFDSNSKDGLKR